MTLFSLKLSYGQGLQQQQQQQLVDRLSARPAGIPRN